MNYRHAFHAGNHADVFKHLLLSRLIALMCRKESPLTYLDSHAGAGLYDLQGSEAQATDEWLQGVARLAPEVLRDPLWQGYASALQQLNTEEPGAPRLYPGSPMLASFLLRPQDRLILNEKHPEDVAMLRANLGGDGRAAIHAGEGWHLARAFLPSVEKRALLLIDPPYEQIQDWEWSVQMVQGAAQRMRQCVVALWYPIKDRRQLRAFYRQLRALAVPKLLLAELLVNPPDNALELNGSGMAVVNPPWLLEDELRSLLPVLSDLLAQKQGEWRLEWLVSESDG